MSTAAIRRVAELIRGEKVHFNLTPFELTEFAIRRNEGKLADNGALVCFTGVRTGRTPKDRFIAKTPRPPRWTGTPSTSPARRRSSTPSMRRPWAI